MDPLPPVPMLAVPSVELLHWPADADRREELRRQGRPRLLLLGPDDLPPGQAPLEDWIRLPAGERDLTARLQRLARQAGQGPDLEPGEVEVDEDGTAAWRGRRVMMSPIEAGIVRRLAATPGRLVDRDELATLVWGDRPRQPHSLDSRIHTVRLRLRPLGLAVHTVRGRGFVLTAVTGDDGA